MIFKEGLKIQENSEKINAPMNRKISAEEKRIKINLLIIGCVFTTILFG